MISHRLRRLRRSKGYTLDHLAEISGVNRGTIHRIELDQVSPRVDTLALLCEALETDFQGFFGPLDPGAEENGLQEVDPSSLGAQAETEAIPSHDLRHGLMDWLEHLEALIHCSADGFAVIDQDGLLIYESQVSINLRAGGIRGRRSQPWFACAHPEDRAALRAGFQKVLAEPDQVVPLEYRVANPDGGWRWVRSTLRNQLKHPAIEGVVINTQDISVWRQAEEQRRALQQFESQLQVMRVLTAEFSNLWMAVQGHLEVDRQNGENPDKLAGLQHSLDRASTLLNHMRDVCGHPTLDLKPLSLNELVLEKVASPAIRLDLGASLPLIEGDQELLGRMIQNLVDLMMGSRRENAGAIRLMTSCCVLDSAEARSQLQLQCQGVEEGGEFVVIDLLDPAGTSDPAHSWNDHGLLAPMGQSWPGLPLPAILRTVRDHHGAMSWEQGETGNRIRIHLPVGRPERVSASQEEGRSQGQAVLVVDDEEFLLEATQQLLLSLGYTTLTARNGQEALAIYAKESAAIGLVLLDLNMPLMNGEETFHALRKVDPAVKVVLCTGSAATGHDPLWEHANLSGILRKPFGHQDLRKLMEDVLPQ